MKKILITMFILLATLTNINAMPYQQAREQALFLTDKMAYELNLNDQQYEAAYEINLDYLMDVTTVDDVYSASWRQRNIDLQYILLDWQYNAFCTASYFFRPLYWNAGNWHFAVYAHYPHHDFFYFGRPSCYVSYRGAHSWRYNGGRSWYVHRVNDFRRPGVVHVGLRDNYRPTPGRRPTMGNDRPGYRDNGQRPGYNNVRPGYNGNARPTYNGDRDNARPNRGNANYNGNRNDRNENGRFDRGNSHSYNRESSTRKTVTNGNYAPGNSSRPNTNVSRPNTNSGYRPTPGSGSSSFSGGTRGGGSTFRGNSSSRPATSSSGVGRR